MHHISLPDVPSFFSGDLERLKIFYTNVDQFLNKKDELEMAIAGDGPDIILITPKSNCNTIIAMRISLSHYQPFLTLIRLLFHLVLQCVVLVFMYQRIALL